MVDNRPQADRILVAKLHGEARHHAKWRELSNAEHDAAVAALRELAAGRADLLAEVAGVLEGTSEGEMDQPLKRQAAMLCRKAGADPEAVRAGSRKGGAGEQPRTCRRSQAASMAGERTTRSQRAAGGSPASRYGA
jgi:hypothetical protein